jgi:predicted acylesterase/phospholipase RssA
MQGSGVTDTQFAGDSPSLSNSQRSEGNLLPIDALVMKGGGVKGLAFAGAVRELQAYFQFEAFVGTSAGAIAAALFAAGATGAMLEETLRRKRFRDFLDGKIWTAPFNIWFFGGIHPGLAFSNWLRDELHRLIRTQSELLMKDLPTRAVVLCFDPRIWSGNF